MSRGCFRVVSSTSRFYSGFIFRVCQIGAFNGTPESSCFIASYSTSKVSNRLEEETNENDNASEGIPSKPSGKLQRIVDEISNLTLVEVADVSAMLKKRLRLQNEPLMQVGMGVMPGVSMPGMYYVVGMPDGKNENGKVGQQKHLRLKMRTVEEINDHRKHLDVILNESNHDYVLEVSKQEGIFRSSIDACKPSKEDLEEHVVGQESETGSPRQRKKLEKSRSFRKKSNEAREERDHDSEKGHVLLDIKLESYDSQRMKDVLKIVKSYMKLAVGPARKLLSTVPVLLPKGLIEEDAARMIEELDAVGAIAVVE